MSPIAPGIEITFTHGDLNMRNVLMHNGRAFRHCRLGKLGGWYPECWDYTKARYVTKPNLRWLKFMDKVFNRHGEYDASLLPRLECVMPLLPPKASCSVS